MGVGAHLLLYWGELHSAKANEAVGIVRIDLSPEDVADTEKNSQWILSRLSNKVATDKCNPHKVTSMVWYYQEWRQYNNDIKSNKIY